ncbi:hypothetical protein EOA32_03270 [Mesorhizobium sp. M1A.F.Ca.ET.072.01.1.1]|nr:hypothetical protein EOA32_03270 [Mesorhizobium sp. M1A.F.Ca.ET.072.01.1.1]
MVRPFAYGADGIHAVDLVIGDEREDFGSSTAGLLLEKYIEEIAAEAVEPVAEDAVSPESDVTHLVAAPEEPRGRRRK